MLYQQRHNLNKTLLGHLNSLKSIAQNGQCSTSSRSHRQLQEVILFRSSRRQSYNNNNHNPFCNNHSQSCNSSSHSPSYCNNSRIYNSGLLNCNNNKLILSNRSQCCNNCNLFLNSNKTPSNIPSSNSLSSKSQSMYLLEILKRSYNHGYLALLCSVIWDRQALQSGCQSMKYDQTTSSVI